MIRLARKALGAVAVVWMVTGPQVARAQDVAVVNRDTIKVTLDNDKVRVLEATLKPGVKEHLHSHPSSIIYVLAGGKVRSHTPDGKVSEATYTNGQTIYRDPLTHWAENIGTTTIHLIVVELKKSAGATPSLETSSPAVQHQFTLDGDVCDQAGGGSEGPSCNGN